MQATNKQSKFNIPGGGWIAIEQDGDKLITQAEGNAAALLVTQIAKREMSYNEAVSYCKMCLMPEKEIIQETIRQQRDFANWCAAQIALIGTKNIQARKAMAKEVLIFDKPPTLEDAFSEAVFDAKEVECTLTPKQNKVIWCLQNGYKLVTDSHAQNVCVGKTRIEDQFYISVSFFWKLFNMGLIYQSHSRRDNFDYILTPLGERLQTKKPKQL